MVCANLNHLTANAPNKTKKSKNKSDEKRGTETGTVDGELWRTCTEAVALSGNRFYQVPINLNLTPFT